MRQSLELHKVCASRLLVCHNGAELPEILQWGSSAHTTMQVQIQPTAEACLTRLPVLLCRPSKMQVTAHMVTACLMWVLVCCAGAERCRSAAALAAVC